MYSARPRIPDEPSREEWIRNHAPTQRWHVFHALESLRCPLVRRRSSGRLKACGGFLERAPHWVREAVVRAAVGGPDIPNSERRLRTCTSCRKTVEVFLVRADPLEATG